MARRLQCMPSEETLEWARLFADLGKWAGATDPDHRNGREKSAAERDPKATG